MSQTDWEEEAEEAKKDSGGILKVISEKLFKKWSSAQDLQAQISQLEEKTSQLKESLRKLTEEEMPELFSEAGVAGIILPNGVTVQVDTSIHCGIPADRKEDAFNWLKANNHGDLIKNEFIVKFGRKEDNLVGEFKATAEKLGLKYDNKQKVEPMTLKAFVKEQMKSGTPLPQDLFGVFVRRVVNIK